MAHQSEGRPSCVSLLTLDFFFTSPEIISIYNAEAAKFPAEMTLIILLNIRLIQLRCIHVREMPLEELPQQKVKFHCSPKIERTSMKAGCHQKYLKS